MSCRESRERAYLVDHYSLSNFFQHFDLPSSALILIASLMKKGKTNHTHPRKKAYQGSLCSKGKTAYSWFLVRQAFNDQPLRRNQLWAKNCQCLVLFSKKNLVLPRSIVCRSIKSRSFSLLSNNFNVWDIGSYSTH